MMNTYKRTFGSLGVVLLLAVAAGCSDSSSAPTAPISDTTPPTVAFTTPRDGATMGVADITATFSEAMMVSTISAATFTVTGPDGAGLPGVVSYNDQTHMATFVPTVPLTPGTAYTARISVGVRDLAGNSMENEKVWTFTTATVSAPETPGIPRSD
jgi:predicted Na+-dependent transporter